MELEELKQKWDLLSQEVEKQKIINTKLLDNVISRKIKNLNTYSFLGCIAYAVIIPIVIMIGQYKHVQQEVIYTAVISMIILLLWEIYNLYLLSKTKSYKNDLISAEKSIIKYEQSKIWSYFAGFVFIFIILLWFFSSFNQYFIQTNNVVLLIVLLTCTIIFAIWEFRWDIGRVKELKKSMDELKKFELE